MNWNWWREWTRVLASSVKLPPYSSYNSWSQQVHCMIEHMKWIVGIGKLSHLVWEEEKILAMIHLLSTAPVVLFVNGYNSHVSSAVQNYTGSISSSCFWSQLLLYLDVWGIKKALKKIVSSTNFKHKLRKWIALSFHPYSFSFGILHVRSNSCRVGSKQSDFVPSIGMQSATNTS